LRTGILRELIDPLGDPYANRAIELGELFLSVGTGADAIHRAVS